MRVSDLSVGVVSYFVGEKDVYAVVLDERGASRRFRVASCDELVGRLDHLVQVLQQPFAWTPSQRARAMRDFTTGWGRELLPPADVLHAIDVLWIVPHHFLHGIPLHAVEWADEQPLATSHGVAYCSSATLLARCVERNQARAADMHGWTFPLDGDAASPGGPPVSTCLTFGVDVLTDNDAAYRQLAQTFASSFAESAEATSRVDIKIPLDPRARNNQGLPQYVRPDAICLVCHGHYDPLSVDHSCLLLAQRRGIGIMRNIRVHNGSLVRVRDNAFAAIPLHLEPKGPQHPRGIYDPEALTVGELRVHCETSAQLVALFGCSTGTGTLTSNDDYLSLAYEWLKTGAASVVANLWEADFPVLTEWARRFAVNWVQLRQPKALAAREATRGLLADRPNLANQPLEWASVAVLGDWL